MQIHQLAGYIQTIYLIEYPHGLLLLDGCSRADVDVIERFIQNTLQRPMSDLKLVLVSHMHPDHAGAAHQLRRKYGCQIASANCSKQWYQGLHGWLMFVTDLALTFWVASRLKKRRKNIWYAPYLQVDIALTDEDLVPGFEDWQVVETPGHTDRDLSFLHRPTDTIYVADLIVKVKGRFIPPFPIFHPNRYKSSVSRLKALSPRAILLAHGGQVSLTDEEFDYLFSHCPAIPKTHWRATKLKMHQLMARYRIN